MIGDRCSPEEFDKLLKFKEKLKGNIDSVSHIIRELPMTSKDLEKLFPIYVRLKDKLDEVEASICYGVILSDAPFEIRS